MKIDNFKDSFGALKLNVKGVTFLEDGFEIRLKPDSNFFDDEMEYERALEEALDKAYNIEFAGFVVKEIIQTSDAILITLVPKSLEEMTDFIWKYVEKYGRREQRLADVLGDAFCVLEKAIDGIPDGYEGKTEAQSNFVKFAGMIF